MSTAKKPNSPARSPVRQNGRPDEEPGMVLRLSSEDPGEEQKLEDLFEIDGQMYQVWTNPSPTIGLRFLKIARTQGELAAGQYLIEALIGEDGYDALSNYEQLTDDQIEFVMKVCRRYALGETEGPGRRGKR